MRATTLPLPGPIPSRGHTGTRSRLPEASQPPGFTPICSSLLFLLLSPPLLLTLPLPLPISLTLPLLRSESHEQPHPSLQQLCTCSAVAPVPPVPPMPSPLQGGGRQRRLALQSWLKVKVAVTWLVTLGREQAWRSSAWWRGSPAGERPGPGCSSLLTAGPPTPGGGEAGTCQRPGTGSTWSVGLSVHQPGPGTGSTRSVGLSVHEPGPGTRNQHLPQRAGD